MPFWPSPGTVMQKFGNGQPGGKAAPMAYYGLFAGSSEPWTVPWESVSQLALRAAQINVVLRYRRWPRSVTQPPLTRADRLVLCRLAQMEVRRPEEQVSASFTDAADEDPPGGAG